MSGAREELAEPRKRTTRLLAPRRKDVAAFSGFPAPLRETAELSQGAKTTGSVGHFFAAFLRPGAIKSTIIARVR